MCFCENIQTNPEKFVIIIDFRFLQAIKSESRLFFSGRKCIIIFVKITDVYHFLRVRIKEDSNL